MSMFDEAMQLAEEIVTASTSVETIDLPERPGTGVGTGFCGGCGDGPIPPWWSKCRPCYGSELPPRHPDHTSERTAQQRGDVDLSPATIADRTIDEAVAQYVRAWDVSTEEARAAIAERHAERERRRAGLRAGAAARDEAIERVDENADPRWKEAAFLALRAVAVEHETLVGDDVWSFLEECEVAPPHEPRAMGAVFQRAKRERLIEPTEQFVPCSRPSQHASPVRVWRSLIVGGEL